ncbi:hypothetical protein D3C85_542150 [compost metagenome]
MQHLGAGDVRRQQVRGELDAAHLRVQVLGQRFHGAGLGQPRQAFEQQVPVGKQADHDLANDLVLAKYRLGNTGLQGVDVSERCHWSGPLRDRAKTRTSDSPGSTIGASPGAC